jgi:hypothetical protein
LKVESASEGWTRLARSLHLSRTLQTGTVDMIDDPDKTSRLFDALKASLPVEARLRASLIQLLSETNPGLTTPTKCDVVEVFYAGEEGGILCRLQLGQPDDHAAHVVSITHLVFERKLPFFRHIDAYQRHRVKKIKQREGGFRMHSHSYSAEPETTGPR